MNALVGLVAIFLLGSVDAQTCAVGGTSTDCTLCPSGKGTVSGPTFGADIALTCTTSGPTPRAINLATSSPNCPITLGGTGTPFSVVPGLLAPATASFAGGASTGDVFFGASSPTPSQNAWFGRYSPTVTLGQRATTVTQEDQSVNVGNRAGTTNVATVGDNLSLQTSRSEHTAAPVPFDQVTRIGWSTSYSPAPATSAANQYMYYSEYSSFSYMATGSTAGPFSAGRLAPSPTPQVSKFGIYSTEVQVGSACPATYISNGGTTTTLTAGYQTPTPVPTGAGNTGYAFSTINLNGKYHEFYSGHCTRTPTAFPTAAAVQCDQTPIYSNTPYTTGAPTSTAGYSSGNGRFYPTQTGVYLVCVTMNIATANQYIIVKYNTGTDASILDLYAPSNVQSVGGCNMVYVASTGSAYFWIDAAAAGITPSPASTINTFAVARIG